MKINAVLTKKPFFAPRKKAPDKNTQTLVLLTLVMGVGIVCGVVLYLCRQAQMAEKLAEYFVLFDTKAEGFSIGKMLLDVAGTDVLLCAFLFLCGSSVYGRKLVYPLLFLKTAGMGMAAAFLIQTYETRGIGFYFLCLFPGKSLLLLALLLLAQNCVHASRAIHEQMTGEGSADASLLRMFCLRSVVALGVCVLSALLTAVSLYLFSKAFLSA